MTFEEILPQLKAGKKAVRTKGWGDCEEYVFVVSGDTLSYDQNQGKTGAFTIYADFMRRLGR